MKEVKVAILGFGGIAKAHKKGYDRLIAEGVPVRLTAVCDIRQESFYAKAGTNLDAELRSDLDGINLYTDCEEMMAKEEIHMVDICLPSYLHKEYAIKMMRAGKHVLSEKPMALNRDDCEEMLKVARETGRRLMIGLCLRFDPLYLYLKECIADGRFGSLRRLVMDRLSAQPRWGFEGWYHDVTRSGGAPMDLHIHDIDMARFLLGEPKEIASVTQDVDMPMQVISSQLFYDGVTVLATASWDESPSVGFSMSYRARFDTATVIMHNDTVTVYPDGGSDFTAPIPKKDRYTEEIRAMVEAVAKETLDNDFQMPESACETVALVSKLVESANNHGKRLIL